MFITTSAKLEEFKDPKNLEALVSYYKVIEEISTNKALPARARFMLQDLLELRANKYAISLCLFHYVVHVLHPPDGSLVESRLGLPLLMPCTIKSKRNVSDRL